MKGLLALAATFFWVVSPLWAADEDRGKMLHDAHCLSCHGTTAYTRPNHFIATLAALQQQVRRCEIPAAAKWSEDDVENVVAYLNHQFYKFTP